MIRCIYFIGVLIALFNAQIFADTDLKRDFSQLQREYIDELKNQIKSHKIEIKELEEIIVKQYQKLEDVECNLLQKESRLADLQKGNEIKQFYINRIVVIICASLICSAWNHMFSCAKNCR